MQQGMSTGVRLSAHAADAATHHRHRHALPKLAPIGVAGGDHMRARLVSLLAGGAGGACWQPASLLQLHGTHWRRRQRPERLGGPVRAGARRAGASDTLLLLAPLVFGKREAGGRHR